MHDLDPCIGAYITHQSMTEEYQIIYAWVKPEEVTYRLVNVRTSEFDTMDLSIVWQGEKNAVEFKQTHSRSCVLLVPYMDGQHIWEIVDVGTILDRGMSGEHKVYRIRVPQGNFGPHVGLTRIVYANQVQEMDFELQKNSEIIFSKNAKFSNFSSNFYDFV